MSVPNFFSFFISHPRTGSSRGRGPRAAGWFHDYIQDQSDAFIKSYVLLEGIKGWARSGEKFVEWMDEYDESAWQNET